MTRTIRSGHGPLPGTADKWMPGGRRAAATPRVTDGEQVSEDLFTGWPLRNVRWSVSYFGFMLYVGVITTYQLGIGDIAMAAALMGLPFERGRFRFPVLLVLLGLLLAWSGVGYLNTLYPAVVWDELVNLAKLWLIALVAVNVLNSTPRIRLFVIFWVLCYALYPARGTLVNYFISGYTLFGRALWNFIYANPNDLAALTLLQVSIAVAIYVTEGHRWVRTGALAALFVLPVVVLLTQSRGTFIGLVAFATLALLGQRRRARAIALGGVVGLGALMFVPGSAWERVGSVRAMTGGEAAIAGMDEEGSAEQRWEIWKTAGLIITDHPFMGVGWGAYGEAHAVYAELRGGRNMSGGRRDAHSTYLNLLAETGWPGLILFIGMIAAVVVSAERSRQALQGIFPRRSVAIRMLELGLLGFLLAGVFASYAKLSFLYLHLAVIWALADVLRRESRRAVGMPGRRPA